MKLVPTILPKYQLVPDFSLTLLFDKFRFYRLLAGNPDRNNAEGIYIRLVYSDERQEYCLQAVNYYRKQIFPYHVNDYHPFYVYYDSNYNFIRLRYDSGHHYAKVLTETGTIILTLCFPWHGYKIGKRFLALPYKTSFFNLNDDTLRSWWLQAGKPQFKLRTKFVDPWHEGLAMQGAVKGNFRDEVHCPLCNAVELLDTMELEDTIFRVCLECQNGHRFTAIYDALSMNIMSLKDH